MSHCAYPSLMNREPESRALQIARIASYVNHKTDAEGFNSCGYASKLQTVSTRKWIEIKNSHQLTAVKTNRLTLENCTVKGTVHTGDKKLLLKKTRVNGVVTTTSRDIVLRDSTVEKLIINKPTDDNKSKSRKLKLIKSRIGELVVYLGDRNIDIVTQGSGISVSKCIKQKQEEE